MKVPKLEDPVPMRTIAVIVALQFAVSPVAAAPICLKGIKPFQLEGDTVEWSMQIRPGADCIQGLRWSFMQIYSVSIAEYPKHGEVVLAGSGFRYFAKQDFSATDSFTSPWSEKTYARKENLPSTSWCRVQVHYRSTEVSSATVTRIRLVHRPFGLACMYS